MAGRSVPILRARAARATRASAKAYHISPSEQQKRDKGLLTAYYTLGTVRG